MNHMYEMGGEQIGETAAGLRNAVLDAAMLSIQNALAPTPNMPSFVEVNYDVPA